jgi:hypothetical protein
VKEWISIAISAVLGFSVVAVAQTPKEKTIPPAQVAPPPPEQPEGKRTLKLKLQVRSPEHLLVKDGDTIRKGQVIADQVDDRQRLTAQKLEVEESLKRVTDTVILDPIAPLKIPELAPLPVANYQAEEAAIEKARRNSERLGEKAKLQQRMLDLLRTTGGSPEMIEHETVKMGEALAEAEMAIAEYDLAKGKLIKAQADYQKLQYDNSVNISRKIEEQSRSAQIYQQRLSEVGNQKRQKESQVTQLKLQLQSIDDKLSLLAQIKSPYDAQVRRIKAIGQSGNFLEFELILYITNPSPNPNPAPNSSILTTPSPDTSSNGGRRGGTGGRPGTQPGVTEIIPSNKSTKQTGGRVATPDPNEDQ